jgi:hypothetical protein
VALRCFLFPADGVSTVDEDGNPFPITGLRVQMTPFYEEATRDGVLVRRDSSAVTSLTQPAVYAPFDIGDVTSELSARNGARVDRYLSTLGDTENMDGARDFFSWIGNTGTVDGYRVKAGSGGNWQRSIDRSRIDVRKFGARANGSASCDQAFEDLITWAQSTAGISASAQEKNIHIFLPAYTQHAYRITSPIQIPATNHGSVTIRGEHWDSASNDVYGSASWENSDIIMGSVIQLDPAYNLTANSIFELHNDGSGPGQGYRRLRLQDVAILGSGNAYGIKMTSDLLNDQPGVVYTNNVYIAGCKVGFQVHSFQRASHYDLRISGCETGLQLGGEPVVGGVYSGGSSAQDFYGVQVEACETGVSLYQTLSGGSFYGGLVQGCDVGFRTLDGCSIGAVSFHGLHVELNENAYYFAEDSAVNYLSTIIGFYDTHFTQPGTTPTNVLRGNGWGFFRCANLQGVPFSLCAGQLIRFLDCRPGTITERDGAGSPSFYEVDLVQRSKPVLFAGASGSIALDFYTHGLAPRFEVTGNITFTAPINYPRGKMINLSLYQGGAGGFTVTWTGFNGEASWSDTGNVSGNYANVAIFADGGSQHTVERVTPYRAI